MTNTIYQEKGFCNRRDYIQQLALEHNVPEDALWDVANMLGEYEDFDGLVSSVQDMAWLFQEEQ